jgi:hypothetical protein
MHLAAVRTTSLWPRSQMSVFARATNCSRELRSVCVKRALGAAGAPAPHVPRLAHTGRPVSVP